MAKALASNTYSAQQNYANAKAAMEKLLNTHYDESGGIIKRLILPGSTVDDSAYIAGGGASKGSPTYQPVEPGNELQQLYDRWQRAKAEEASFSSLVKSGVYELIGDGGGTVDAAKAYRDAEQLKTKEIKRQFDDFASRADELYELYKAESSANMAADDQNIQNQIYATTHADIMPQYGHITMANRPLSSILAPSLPSYVRPDYRNNQGVGLPGPQGFDDPDYDANGMPPQYAFGTIPPGFVPVDQTFRIAAIAPWDVRARMTNG